MIVKIILILEVVMKQLNNDQLNKYVGGGKCARWMFAATILSTFAAGPIGGWAAATMGFAFCEWYN